MCAWQPATAGPLRHGDGNAFLGKGQFNYPGFCFVTTQGRAAQTQKAPCGKWESCPVLPRAGSLLPGFPKVAKRGWEKQAHGNDGVKAKPQTSRFSIVQRSKENVSVVQWFL